MIEQRSQQWFEQRKGKITGSVAGAILGLDPNKSRSDVMRDMVRSYHGESVEVDEFLKEVVFKYGIDNEPNAIADFEFMTGLDVEETGFHLSNEFPWLGASPDGFVKNQTAVIEIKCPYGLRNDPDPRFKTVEQVPHYNVQMQIEMFCTGTRKCHFYQWSPFGESHQIVKFDADYFYLEILPELKKFYDEYLENIEKPERFLIKGIKNDTLANKYRTALANFDAAKLELDAIKAELIDIASGEKCEISGLQVYPVNKQGSISYAKAIKDLMPTADLEPYRGKPTTYWIVK